MTSTNPSTKPATILTTRLKDDNWALHQIAERQDTPGSLIKGTMPRHGYISMLAQQLLVNTALDTAIKNILPGSPELNTLILDEQLLTPYLIEDLRYFEINHNTTTPAPGTQRFIDHIDAHKDQPLHLLGLHYVRLGACNGNSFVARVVRKTYAIAHPTDGTRYLDPFGATQRKKWIAFKSGLDALTLSDDEKDQIFVGTRAAYVQTINLDLPEQRTGEELLSQHRKTLDQKAFEHGHSVHVQPKLEN